MLVPNRSGSWCADPLPFPPVADVQAESDQSPSDAAEARVTFHHPSAGTVTLLGESADEYVFALIRRAGNFYEGDLLDVIEHLGLPSGVAIDVGAHIGNHSVFFARALGLETIAFEAHPKNASLLRQNVDLNGVSHLVEPRQVALGERSTRGRLEQRIPGNSGSFVVIEDEAGAVEISRLDEQVPATTPVVLIKIDVEGNEREVVLGGLETIERCLPVLTVETHTGQVLDGIQRILEQFDYAPVAVGGRSDNYVLVSRSPRSVVVFDRADRRSRLASDRRRARILESGLREVGTRLRSLGLQQVKESSLTATDLGPIRDDLEDLLQVVGDLEANVSGQRAVIEQLERAVARWRHEYERLSRSRALRTGAWVRRLLSRIGLGAERPVIPAAQIEEQIEAAENRSDG